MSSGGSLKLNLVLKIIPKDFFRLHVLEWIAVTINGKKTYLLEFTGENNFLDLFAGVWISA